MLDSMEMRYCPKLAVATPEQQLGVLGLLYLCDQEFLPPLSQRDDTRQKDFLDSIGMGVEAYFAALLEQACLLLLCGTEVAGFLSFIPRHYMDAALGQERFCTYVTTGCVHPERRGHGLARALLTHFLEELVPGMQLNPRVLTRTWSTNAATRGVLEGMGFSILVRLPGHRGGGVDTLYYEKTV